MSMLWNGPVCPTCGSGYLIRHTCSPAELRRKARDLVDLARHIEAQTRKDNADDQ